MSGRGGSVLVVDVGHLGGAGRAWCAPTPRSRHVHHVPVLPDTPAPGLVEFDAAAMAAAVLEVATGRPGRRRPGGGRRHRQPAGHHRRVGPGHRASRWPRASAGRTCARSGTCLELQAEGIRLAPNASATKLAAILDAVDPDRARAERASCASAPSTPGWPGPSPAGAAPRHRRHQRRRSPGWLRGDAPGLGRPGARRPAASPRSMLPDASSTPAAPSGEATALPGAPPICGMAGDQQASLIGQGCTRPGLAKATFGTGGMLDLCTGRCARPMRSPGASRHLPHRGLAARRGRSPGASRPSCCPPAPAWSGCATTSA